MRGSRRNGMSVCGFSAKVAGVSILAMGLAVPALAGGFAIREQSASSQGASFAGNAANTDLSAMFWNPAGAANVSGPGITTENHIAVIIPSARVTVDGATGAPAGIVGAINAASPSSTIADWAVVPASYASYQVSSGLFLGISTNGGFGLTTKPDDRDFAGAVLGRTSKLFTTNITPIVAYKVAPWATIGVGVQAQYADGKFGFATGVPAAATAAFEGDDIAFGATAGIMLTPAAGTRIGLGWRSALTHELEGRFGTSGGAFVNATAKLALPDIVTLSVNQAISPNMRLLATVEWSNWSRFEELRVRNGAGATLAAIDTRWSDGWFFSLGGEYDVSRQLTVRAGGGYELSPVDDPTKRLTGVPDNDRIWLSFGGSYKLSESSSLDFAYTHIFIEDGRFDRTVPGVPSVNVTGNVEASTDIVSFSYKTRWGAHAALK